MKRAFFNNYPDRIPYTELVSKEARSLLQRVTNRLKAGENPTLLLCFPELPGSKTTLFKIAAHLGINLTNKPGAKAQIAIYFENKTLRTHDEEMMELLHQMKVINLFSRDISKDKVDADFVAVFGYSTQINPKEHQGPALEKSLENARHDGRTIQCPTDSVHADCIYQRIIDNSCGLNEVVDIRVPIIGKSIPHVYSKYKLEEHRYTNKVHRSTMHEASELFSAEELLKIHQFAVLSKLDFGELDILRDTNDGKIYIVDVNNTPYGPPQGLSAKDNRQAIQNLSRSFKNEFLKQ
jgi:hypothetical protein